jgi:hypothetical protein
LVDEDFKLNVKGYKLAENKVDTFSQEKNDTILSDKNIKIDQFAKPFVLYLIL